MALDIGINTTTTTMNANVADLTEQDALYQLNSEMRYAVLWVSIYVGIEAVLGFFGNLLVLYVFSFRYHVCNFRYFVMCLASIDFIGSVSTMPGEVVTQMFWYIYPSRTLCKVKSFFNVFTISAEAFCLFTIAVDRYLKVCRPFGKQITPRKAQILCGIIYISSTVLATPTAIFWGTYSTKKHYKGTNITVTICEVDTEYRDSSSPLEFVTVTEVIVALVLIAMFALYVLVARQLIKDRFKLKPDLGPATYRRQRLSADGGIEISSTDGLSSTDGNLEENCSSQPKLDSSATSQTTKSESLSTSRTGVPTVSFRLENRPKMPIGDKTNDAVNDKSSADDASVQIENTTGNSSDVDVKPKKKPTWGPASLRRLTMHRRNMALRVRRKTKIMLFLTVSFFITAILYLTLLDIIARNGDELERNLTFGQKAVYFFFFRLVFINHVINPIVYGFWDSKFRQVLIEMKDRVIKIVCCRR